MSDSWSSTSSSSSDARWPRRAWLGVAAVSAAAGVGTAWWRFSPAPVADGVLSTQLWPLVLDTPDGASLRLADFQGRALVLNFWATWCPPCIEELPMLNAFFQRQRAKGWQVLGLAVDQTAPVQRFLQKQPLAFPVGMAGLAGTELSKHLGNLNGGLPFTVVIDRQGHIVQRKLGKLSEADVSAWADLSV